MNSGTMAALSLSLMASALCLAGAPAKADNVATRCTAYGCEAIRCNYTGDRCYHVDGDDMDRAAFYGAAYERPWYEERIGYGGHLVCDSDGDRCYRSDSPFWNYREYYRRHGYRWANEAYVPPYPGDAYAYAGRYRYREAERGYYGRSWDDAGFDWRR